VSAQPTENSAENDYEGVCLSPSPSVEEMRALGTALKMYDDFKRVDDVAFEWIKAKWREAKPEELDEDQRLRYYDLKKRFEDRVEGLNSKIDRFIKKYGVNPILRYEENKVTIGFEDEQAKGYKTYLLEVPEWFEELIWPKPAVPPPPVPPPTVALPRALTLTEIEKLETMFTDRLRMARVEPEKWMKEFLDTLDEIKYLPYEEAEKEITKLAKDVIEAVKPPPPPPPKAVPPPAELVPPPIPKPIPKGEQVIQRECYDLFSKLWNEIRAGAAMEVSIPEVSSRTGIATELIRKALSRARVKNLERVERLANKLLECECLKERT